MPKKNAPVAAAASKAAPVALPVYTSLTSLLKAKTLGKTPKGMKCIVGTVDTQWSAKGHTCFMMPTADFAKSMAKSKGFAVADGAQKSK